MQLPPDAAEIRRRRATFFHKMLFLYDLSFSCISLVLSLICAGKPCPMSFFAYYCLFYLSQAIKHYLCGNMPKMNVVKYDKVLKRYIFAISVIEISFFLLAFMYWTKSDMHPFYCFVVGSLGLPFPIGGLFMVQFIFSLLVYIQFLHGFITRKYYLLAMGGFEVEQRLIQQREENLRRLSLIQPFYNQYPVFVDEHVPQRRKTFQFDDIPEDVEGQQVCSICLNRQKQGCHPIYTPCKHFFHRECIEDWATINSKCPECRADFKQLKDVLSPRKSQTEDE